MVNLMKNQLCFSLQISEIRNGIFIPKYYNPGITIYLHALEATHELVCISDLIDNGNLVVATGDEIGKMAYGTGEIPFVRTSDISNWEIKNDPKQGVGQYIYEQYATKQDVRAGDIFFVRDGTYLIGQSCFVTNNDLPCLYQSHILKFRIKDGSPISSLLFFACLNAPIVKKQIRAKQFTADIIDTIGNRYRELILPVPKNYGLVSKIVNGLDKINCERIQLREIIRKIPFMAQGIIHELSEDLPLELLRATEHKGNAGFKVPFSKIRSGVFIPKYYDPQLEENLSELSKTHSLVKLSELVNAEILSWETGIEIGKMAYGTGSIPFIRTSDISNWELKRDPKQNVSEEIYETYKQDIQPEDIFIVRDGTYLVGTSCILTEHDTNILYCGGIYKLRIEQKDLE